MKEVVVIIPAYKPDKKIMSAFMEKLEKNFEKIVIIDDGSGEEYQSFFQEYHKKGITVLRNHINLGKGRAIKYAFNYCLNTYDTMVGTVTADCDGQHSVEDIKKCCQSLIKNPESLIIGTRNFDLENVPFKSRYGNKITRNMFSIFVGIKITDTQSGLRAFGKSTMKKFLDVSGERYEYETNMLIACKEKEIKIEEVPIKTIYIGENETSHFNPIRDSILIYKLFIKYIMASLSSFLVDILLFTLFLKLLPEINFGMITSIVVASLLARTASSIYNFKINEKIVFKNKSKNSLIKYFILVIIQMFVSAFVVSGLFKMTHLNSTLLKIMVDLVIFVINFIIQREWVFKKK
ncbi:MAG: glycosyltransferase [Bacilli bacterium]|nr:glycosyltransferase [Bacilli bacterium]